MFCEPYLYVTSLVNLYLYVWYANYVIKDNSLETMTQGYKVGALNLPSDYMYLCLIKLLTKEPKTECSECLSKQLLCSLRIYL